MMKDRVEGPKFKMPPCTDRHQGDQRAELHQGAERRLEDRRGTALSEIVSSDLIAKKYPLLGQAAGQVGVPQIRNVGTLGGNLCQRPRCWYFRGSAFPDCFRKGGDNCYAPGGENRYHAIIGGELLQGQSLGSGPALMALNARVEIASPKGSRMVPVGKILRRAGQKYLGGDDSQPPGNGPGRGNSRSGRMSKGVYLKLKERQAFDFAIVSVAVNLSLKNNVVTMPASPSAACALPDESVKAEAALKGKGVKECSQRRARQPRMGQSR